MNREIKFRAWDTKNNIMLPVNSLESICEVIGNIEENPEMLKFSI